MRTILPSLAHVARRRGALTVGRRCLPSGLHARRADRDRNPDPQAIGCLAGPPDANTGAPRALAARAGFGHRPGAGAVLRRVPRPTHVPNQPVGPRDDPRCRRLAAHAPGRAGVYPHAPRVASRPRRSLASGVTPATEMTTSPRAPAPPDGRAPNSASVDQLPLPRLSRTMGCARPCPTLCLCSTTARLSVYRTRPTICEDGTRLSHFLGRHQCADGTACRFGACRPRTFTPRHAPDVEPRRPDRHENPDTGSRFPELDAPN